MVAGVAGEPTATLHFATLRGRVGRCPSRHSSHRLFFCSLGYTVALEEWPGQPLTVTCPWAINGVVDIINRAMVKANL